MNIDFISDVAILVDAINQLSGVDTERLYVHIDSLPILDVNTGKTVGTFLFDETTETFEFRTCE